MCWKVRKYKKKLRGFTVENIDVYSFNKIRDDELFELKILLDIGSVVGNKEIELLFLIYEEILKDRLKKLLKHIDLNTINCFINFNIKAIMIGKIFTEINICSDIDLSSIILEKANSLIYDEAGIREFDKGLNNIRDFLKMDLSDTYYLFNSYSLFYKYGLIPINHINKEKFVLRLENITIESYNLFQSQYIKNAKIIIIS